MQKELDVRNDADWKQRFRAASIQWARLASKNPARGVVCSNKDGIYQLYAWDVETGELTKRTDQPAGLLFGAISANGGHIYFFQDEQGNEIGHWVRVPFEGGEVEDLTPEMPPYASFGLSESRDGTTRGFMTAGQDGFKIYVDNPTTGRREIFQSKRLSYGPALSNDGEIAVIHTTERTGTVNTHVIAFDTKTGEKLNELWDGEEVSTSAGPFSPAPGDSRVLATSSKSGYDLPLIWDPRSGERRYLQIDEIEGEVTPWEWSPDAKYILLNQLYQSQFQLYLYNLETDILSRLNHPEGVVGGFFGGEFTEDGEILLTWQDPANASRLIALDARTGEQTRIVLTAGDALAGKLMKSVFFTSENGKTIQGWLATPDGEGPFPTILHTHGGPSSVMSPYYAPECQGWLDHGFAFFTINYHGSVTFGKDFETSIWGNLGDLEVQDMAGAYRWLVENNIAIPDSVLLTGGSYGGYLTLQAIGKRPDLWAGGMGVVAIADWNLMYEDQAETLRGYQLALFGGTPEEKPEAHKKSSPITYAENIRAPLLVIQGKNDTRCPSRQMEVYEKKLKSLGKQIEIYWFDAGHGSRAQEEQIDQMERKLRFAFQVLG